MVKGTQIPNGWRVARLRELLVLDQPGVWGEEPTGDDSAVPVLRAADLTKDGRIDLSRVVLRRISDWDIKRRLMRDGDLILERSGGGPGSPVGRVALIQDHEKIYCSNFCQQLRFDTHQAYPPYMFRYLWRQYLLGVTTRLEQRTTGIRNLDYSGYLLQSVTLPPLPEQRAIAAILDSIDEAIERTETVIAATERLRESLLHELLTHGALGWHSEWKEVRRFGTMPASWDVVRLGELAEVRNGNTPSRANPSYWNNGTVPFVKTGRVNDVTIDEPDEFITSEAVTSAGAVVVPQGSVLIAMIGQGKTRGMTARLGFSAAINQNFAAVHNPQEGLNLEFLFTWARHNYSFIRNLGQGSNQDALNCELIQGMRIPKPPDAEQRAIAGLDGYITDAIERAREVLIRLQSLKASTADGLLTGRMRVTPRAEAEHG